MKFIHMRQQQVLTWQDELPLIVRRRVIKEKGAFRLLTMIFGHNETFKVMEDVFTMTVTDLLAKHCDYCE